MSARNAPVGKKTMVKELGGGEWGVGTATERIVGKEVSDKAKNKTKNKKKEEHIVKILELK